MSRDLNKVRAVCFDLDDTLIDSSKLQDAIPETCKKLADRANLDAARLVDANSRIWQSYWPTVEKRWALGTLSSREISEEAWRRTLHECGRDDNALARLAVEILSMERRNALRLYDDVRETFNQLKPRYRLGLVTNGASDTQRGAIRALGIEELFDAIVISGEIGVQKPDASVFALAVRKLDVEAENTWHVGDNLRTDVAGALGAGLIAVWINRTGASREDTDPRPHHEIRSLKELLLRLSEKTVD
jgi:HAD superfamily hydrolase (TIGR02253 family)